MTTFALDVNGDLVRTDSGSYRMVSGVEEVTERIIRRVVTNPQTQLANGRQVAGDYPYHPEYGLGFGSLLQGVTTDSFFTKMSSLIRQGVLEDADTIKDIEPVILLIQETFDTITVNTRFRTINGEEDNFTLDFTRPSP